MYTGIFFTWDFLFISLVALSYFVSPKSIIEKKHYYVKFFLSFLVGYFMVFIVLKNIIAEASFLKLLFVMFLPTLLFLYHRLYRFKTFGRNKSLVCMTVFVWGLLGVAHIIGRFFINGM